LDAETVHLPVFGGARQSALGLEGWELVGVTGKHAAFKRRLGGGDSVSR
jgi:hypothetical protein